MRPYTHGFLCFVDAAGEGLDFTGEPLIREESVEGDVSGDGRPDIACNQGQAEQEKEKSSSTDQQTQESEVGLIRGFRVTISLLTAEQLKEQLLLLSCYLYYSFSHKLVVCMFRALCVNRDNTCANFYHIF